MSCIQCCHVSNRSVSNWLIVQFYRVQSIQCLIPLCPNGVVSNPTVPNRFGVQSWRVQSVRCPILLLPIGPTALYYVSNPHVSNGFNHPIKLFVCPIVLCPTGSVSNRTCVSNAVVMWTCPIGSVFNRSVSNWFGVQSYCVQLHLCPVFLYPITCVQSVRVQSECVQLGITQYLVGQVFRSADIWFSTHLWWTQSHKIQNRT